MLANLAAWPVVSLAQVLEHELEQTQEDARNPSTDPASAHCPHGCFGHYSQHFQFQTPVAQLGLPVAVSDSVSPAPGAFPPQHVPTQPFRPPLIAKIRS